MTDKAEIIAKIKKCLALSKSSNEHEAAAALRQAQKLMEQYGIDTFDIETAEIEEGMSRSGAATSPAQWESVLAACVGNAFNCRVVFRSAWSKPNGEWIFVGISPAPEIAKYAFDVLYRQAKRARTDYVKTSLKRCGQKNKVRRADLFSEGWVVSATNKLIPVATNEATQALLTGYMEQKFNLQPLKPRDRNAGRNLSEREWDDRSAGHRSGRYAELNKGVGGNAAPLALE